MTTTTIRARPEKVIDRDDVYVYVYNKKKEFLKFEIFNFLASHRARLVIHMQDDGTELLLSCVWLQFNLERVFSYIFFFDLVNWPSVGFVAQKLISVGEAKG